MCARANARLRVRVGAGARVCECACVRVRVCADARVQVRGVLVVYLRLRGVELGRRDNRDHKRRKRSVPQPHYGEKSPRGSQLQNQDASTQPEADLYEGIDALHGAWS